MKRYNKVIYTLIINLFIFFALSSNVNVFAADTPENIMSTGKSLINQYYIEDVPASTLDAAKDMNSLIKSLNDPYSVYFTEKQYNEFVNSINNSFSGIGVQLDLSDEGIKITSVFDKTPAMEAGLMAEDIIIEADGHSLKGLPIDVAVKYIKGAPGTKVNLKVKRDNSILEFNVSRQEIVLPTVNGEMLDNHIGYIKISSFGQKTNTEFKNVLSDLKKNSPDSYIIDLRNNPGGYMDVAFNIAGYFIGDNVVLKAYQKDGKVLNYKAVAQEFTMDKPVIFLINKNSASASEILSAAVKDYNKAYFVGEKTFGKGVAQNIFMLPDKSYIKLTVFKFVSPLGNEINKIGISPDLQVKDDAKKGIDALSTARKILTKSSEINTVAADEGSTVNSVEDNKAAASKVSSNDVVEKKLNYDNGVNDKVIENESYYNSKVADNQTSNNSVVTTQVSNKDNNILTNNEKINKSTANHKSLKKTRSFESYYIYIGLGVILVAAGAGAAKKLIS